MLRKKMKLDDQSEPSPAPAAGEFTLSRFANTPKPKLTHDIHASHLTSKFETVAEGQPAGIVASGTAEPYWQRVYRIELKLSAALRNVALPTEVAACYDPIAYAGEIHRAYMDRFLDGPKHVLFIGMNPGPWGMCQTGVPFGYVPAVRDWMGLRGTVQKPEGELSVRPVEGLSCTRDEQSGKRWWGLFEELCGVPEAFFRSCFVYNLCPLAFFHKSGRNITPSELKGNAKGEIQAIAEQHLAEALQVLQPKIIISVGRYTEDRVKTLIKQNKLDATAIRTLCIAHPSPRSLNNTNWNEKAKRWLEDNGIMPFLKHQSTQ
ncbi:single-strand selective monofunctional uracil DNA glycosylase [Anopheles aquasalis]|uniref:single-strand selective monofunctional uracil DNA glycosylase n=1 Tax=Anopheles aquasalis TaxID=42839 RepID=UPI00215A1A8C|nr:single-strand selective monofunctional uracil DNA glycosylase [Anopheles aquasalis]XP_050085195.1 single-strand selective monofunctional uracil DNA glycosylase [Anopheles aquasalis]